MPHDDITVTEMMQIIIAGGDADAPPVELLPTDVAEFSQAYNMLRMSMDYLRYGGQPVLLTMRSGIKSPVM